jgi:hypothetical protein
MARSKSAEQVPRLVKSDTWEHSNHKLISGTTEVTVQGIGRCTFHGHVVNRETGESWVDVWSHRRNQWRAVEVDRITRVHRTVVK